MSYSSKFRGLLGADSFDAFSGLLSQYFPQWQGHFGQTPQTPQTPQVPGTPAPGYPAPPPGAWNWGISPQAAQQHIAQMPMSVPPLSTASSQFQSNYGNLVKDLYGKSKGSKSGSGDRGSRSAERD